jgi:hypothetical protein
MVLSPKPPSEFKVNTVLTGHALNIVEKVSFGEEQVQLSLNINAQGTSGRRHAKYSRVQTGTCIFK